MADEGLSKFTKILQRFQNSIQGAMGTPTPAPVTPRKNILNPGPVKLPKQLTTKELLHGGRTPPKSQIPGQSATNVKVNAPGKGIKTGGIAGAAAYVAGDALIPHISREAVRGALVVTGQDTTDFDRLNSGQPVVRNVGGVSYNIATPEGRSGYNSALKSGAKPSEPAPTPAPKTYTVSGVEYDVESGQAINPDTGKTSPSGYSVSQNTGKMTPLGTDTSSGGRQVTSDADEAMRIWARTHGKLAQEVVDKVEKRGLTQAGYVPIKQVLQPEMYPTKMAGDQPNIPYSADNTGVEGLRRTDTPEVSADIKTKGQSSTYTPQFNAPDADKLMVEPDGLIMSTGEIVKIPDQTGIAPQTLPAGFPEAQKEAQTFFSQELRKNMKK